MTKYSFNNVHPFEATHVGEVVNEELTARGMSRNELSRLTVIEKYVLSDIIEGRRGLTSEVALKLEKALGISAAYLMNIQKQYELDR